MTHHRLAIRAGLIGAGVMSIGLIIAALAYRSDGGDTYSPFSQFVSELGHTGQSELWFVFSAVVIIGGLLFMILMSNLVSCYSGAIRRVLIVLSLLTGAFGALVGLFPMDVNRMTHGYMALGFFLSSLILIVLFSLLTAFSQQNIYPKWLAWVGVPVVVSSVIFLATLLRDLVAQGMAALDANAGQSTFDILPTSEWGVILFLNAWVVVMAIHLASRSTSSTNADLSPAASHGVVYK